MLNPIDLKGKTILITGGSRGIGLTIAEACAKNGGNVVITARNEKEIEKACEHLKSHGPGKILGIKSDASSAQQTQSLMESVQDEFGKLYSVVAAAGIYGDIGPFAKCEFKNWIQAIDVNLIGTARTLHAAYPLLKKEKNARVILFSGGGQGPIANFTSYVTSKGGVWRFTESLGHEWAPDGIFVNAIAPGAINTKFLDELLEAGPDKVGAALYKKSMEQKESGGHSPIKAANLALYLLSEKSLGLYGKTLSALWDDYENLEKLEALSQSDLFCMRRVVSADGRTRES